MAYTYNTIEYSVADEVALLVLNRPDSLNSFNREMHAEVRDVLDKIKQSGSVRCLVLTGKGRAFCAGQDLNDRKYDPAAPPDLGESLLQNYNPLVQTITSLEIPVICAVNGVAAGAGVGIALACDIVLAARSSSFILSFARVGLGMDSACSWSLPRLIGLARARALALLGEKLSAQTAEDWGLIWKCFNDDELMDETMAIARNFTNQPTKGLAIIKKELLESTGNSITEQLLLEAELQRIAGQTEDYREGVLSFLERRTPKFKGK